MGYSANTISLLAMVLAIGILVDDAIVVVENVERVMEEEPDLSPADATKKAMTEITGPIIAITLVLLSVFVPIAFIPGIAGTVVPPVCGDDQRRDADLGVERADLVAGAVRRVSAPPRPEARPDGLGAAAASTKSATAMPRSCAVWCACRCSVSSRYWPAPPAVFRHLAAHADRVSAGRGSGRLLHRGAIAGRGVGRPHQRGGAAHRGAAEADAAGSERVRDHRVFDHRQRQRAECGFRRPYLEAVRRPRRRGELGAGADRAGIRRRAAGPHGDRHPVQPAADHRPVDDRRVRIRARRARRAGARRR